MSSLYETVKFLTSLNPARSHENTDSLDKAAEFIKSKFQEYSLECELQEYSARDRNYKNIIGSINTHFDKRLIIGAHYDVCGEMQGADDNASGIAGLLECARLLSLVKDKLNFRVDFVAYTLEEPPYFYTEKMGSYIHAKSLKDQDVTVIGMINFEMIGYFTDKPNSQSYPVASMRLVYPSAGDFIAVVGDMSSSALVGSVAKYMQKHIKTVSLSLPQTMSDITRSDHMNYWKFGYNAVMITDTADFRNPNYHKKSDTIDTLNFEKIKAIADGCVEAVVNIGQI